MNSGRALREARQRIGLTQRALAYIAGVPQPAIARIESGRVIPRVDTLDRLLRSCDARLEVTKAPDDGVDLEQLRERLRWTPRQRLEELVSSAEALTRIRGKAR